MMRLAAWRFFRRKSKRCFSAAVLEDVVIGSVARTPIGAFCGGHGSHLGCGVVDGKVPFI